MLEARQILVLQPAEIRTQRCPLHSKFPLALNGRPRFLPSTTATTSNDTIIAEEPRSGKLIGCPSGGGGDRNRHGSSYDHYADV